MNQNCDSTAAGQNPRVGAFIRLAVGSLAFALAVPSVFAQTNTIKPLASNRWLLVVDTSRPMQRRAEATQQITAMLLMSGMNGQMQSGDTLGIWTFNDDLYAGQFPLQTWTRDSSKNVAQRAILFLQRQKFEKASRLDKVVSAIGPLITNSDLITVFLISSGQEKIHGTPFDDDINRVYGTWQAEQEKARMPVLTVLRGEHGRLTAHTVNMPPWPLDIPPLPVETRPPQAPEKVKAPIVVPPLIIIGKKPATAQTNVAAPTPVSRPPTTETNAAPVSGPTLAPAAGAAEPPPSATAPASNSSPPVVVALAETPIRPQEPSKNIATVAPVADTEISRTTTQTVPADNHIAVPAAASSEAASGAPARSNTAASAAAASTGPAETATTVAPQNVLSRNLVWVGAVLAVLVVGAILLVRRRRSRAVPHISLITRSLDSDKK